MLAWQLQCSPVDVAGVRDAVGARVDGERAACVDHRHLADGRQRIGREQLAERLRRAGMPSASRSSAFGPYAGSTTDCVATAPTPARAHAHSGPTENQCDCTATPSSPVGRIAGHD